MSIKYYEKMIENVHQDIEAGNFEISFIANNTLSDIKRITNHNETLNKEIIMYHKKIESIRETNNEGFKFMKFFKFTQANY